MTKQTIVTLIDDINGEPAEDTVTFALDGKEYEIDLTAEHAGQLRADLAFYIEAARVLKKAPARSRRTRTTSTFNGRSYDPAAVREWAIGQGLDVGKRGRLAPEVLTAYLAGH